ncbi:MAG: type II toxin-antitoxin system Phd/YefM family antitoxin [Candidatus Daviesbacteria bacterium]|nr:type II toxin-antitoxin system Phd/YefM family antitoxin [Candidatus Daviesbacteria bacterium]
MTTISASTARANLYDLIDQVALSGKRVGITKKGESKVVLISQDDLDSLEATLDVMSDPELMEAIRQGDEDIKAGRVRDWEDIKKELGLDSKTDVSSQTKQSRRKRS